jgi:hypothetical protein
LKNDAKIGIKVEKEGKWGKRKVRPFFKVELHLSAKNVKAQALNCCRHHFFK